MPSLETAWSSDDPDIRRMLTSVQEEADPVLRLELLAALHTFQAAKHLRDAGALRERLRDAERRRHDYPRVCCLGCRALVSVNAAGDLRPHGPVRNRCLAAPTRPSPARLP